MSNAHARRGPGRGAWKRSREHTQQLKLAAEPATVATDVTRPTADLEAGRGDGRGAEGSRSRRRLEERSTATSNLAAELAQVAAIATDAVSKMLRLKHIRDRCAASKIIDHSRRRRRRRASEGGCRQRSAGTGRTVSSPVLLRCVCIVPVAQNN